MYLFFRCLGYFALTFQSCLTAGEAKPLAGHFFVFELICNCFVDFFPLVAVIALQPDGSFCWEVAIKLGDKDFLFPFIDGFTFFFFNLLIDLFAVGLFQKQVKLRFLQSFLLNFLEGR